MGKDVLAARARAALEAYAPLRRLMIDDEWWERMGRPGVCDFTVGNPHDLPPEGFVEALKRHLAPENPYWFAYKLNEPSSRKVVAGALREWRGVPFEEEDIFVTNGATAALHVILETIVGPGDEAIFISPPWFMYEGMIALAGGTPVRVKADPRTFDLDLKAIEGAITQRTRAVIVNSPHNPSGKIYTPETLRSLAEILTKGSGRAGRPVFLVSDESYSRIVFDGRTYHSPTSFYSNSFIAYTYGKVLLTPGQRMGFIAIPPTMPDREAMRDAIGTVQMLAGWAFPNALLQHAWDDLEKISVDIPHLQRKRDRMVKGLRDAGYETTIPEGTFYILARSPIENDVEFIRMLARRDVFCVPGATMDIPGWFRISLTANDGMIDRGLPKFADAFTEAGGAAR